MDTTAYGAFIRSKSFLIIIGALLFLGLLLGSFSVGMAIGYHNARESYAWGESYNRVFAGPRGGFMGGVIRDFDGRDYIDAHGVFGEVVRVEGQSLVLSARDGLERVVVVLPTTEMRKFRDAATINDIRVGDSAVIVGTPDSEGRIQAQLIRIMPYTDGMMPSPKSLLPR